MFYVAGVKMDVGSTMMIIRHMSKSKTETYEPFTAKDVTSANCIRHIGDPDYEIRAKVASLGGGLEILVDDPHWLVRKEVAKQGYGLEKLVKDPDEDVRVEVAKHGYRLDILEKDESEYVRAEAKLQKSKR